MFALKIQYKGKVLNLGKDITSLARVDQEVKKRFPVDFKYGVIYFYAEQEIKNFEILKSKAQESKLSSIKVRIDPGKFEKRILSETSSLLLGIPNQESSSAKNTEIQKPKLTIQHKLAAFQQKQQQKVQQNQTQIVAQKIQNQKQSSELSFKSSDESDKKEVIQPQLACDKQESLHSFQSEPKVDGVEGIRQIEFEKNEVSQLMASKKNSSSIKLTELLRKRSKSQKSVKQISQKFQHSNYGFQKDESNSSQIACFWCKENQKMIESQENQCSICKGKRKLGQKNPLVIFINEVAQKKARKMLDQVLQEKVMNILKQLDSTKIRSDRDKKQSFVCSSMHQQQGSLENLTFQIRERTKMPEKVQTGTRVTWKILIINTGEDFPGTMELYDEDSGFQMLIAKLKTGQSQQINLGPMIFQNQGQAKKSYRIGFLNEQSSFKFLKKKFGFELMVEKEQKKSILTNNFRKRVMEIAKLTHNKQSIEYLIEKFREMGINEANGHQSSNEIIADIIKLLQENS